MTKARTGSIAVARLGALSDPTRWALVELLAGGERCVCDLEASLGAAQSRLSYHLGVLRDAGLVHTRREGRWIYYSLQPEPVAELAAELRELSERWRAVGRRARARSCT